MPVIVSCVILFFEHAFLTYRYSSSTLSAFCKDYKNSRKQVKFEDPEGSNYVEVANGVDKPGRTLDDKRAQLRTYFFDAFGTFSVVSFSEACLLTALQLLLARLLP